MRAGDGKRTGREHIPMAVEVPIRSVSAQAELMRSARHTHVQIESCRERRAVGPGLCSIAESEAAGAHVELCEMRNVSGIQAPDSHLSHVEKLGCVSRDVGEIGGQASRYYGCGAH